MSFRRGKPSRPGRRRTYPRASGRKRAFTNGADFRPANSDIGKRVVIERHQLIIGPFPPPPIDKSLPGRTQEVQDKHTIYPNVAYAALHNMWRRIKAMPATLLQFSHAELLGGTQIAGR
jgi:hypothetical protein